MNWPDSPDDIDLGAIPPELATVYGSDRTAMLKALRRRFMLRRLAEAQNHRCCYCGRQFVEDPNSAQCATREHIIPRSQGGGDEWGNLVAACAECNQTRGDLDAIAFYWVVATSRVDVKTAAREMHAMSHSVPTAQPAMSVPRRRRKRASAMTKDEFKAPVPRIVSIAVGSGNVLVVRWHNGVSARIDLSAWIKAGGDTLAQLRQREVFATAALIDHGWAVRWDGDEELVIDSVHLDRLAEGKR